MITTILTVVFLVVLVTELCLGIAVIGWQGDHLFIERSKAPGQYWLMMALHTIAGIGVPVLTFVAGV